MSPDDFEQQLRNQPLRSLPSTWRAEILETARRATRPQRSAPILQLPWWQEWLWPGPQAWAGLAAVWVILLGLRLTAPSTPAPWTAQRPPSPEAQMALAAQRREMTRLLDGPAESTPVSKPSVPGPRSDRMPPFKA